MAKRTYVHPGEIGVPVRTDVPLAIDFCALSTGGIMRCLIVQKRKDARVFVTVFAHAYDVDRMDLSWLRIDGHECLTGRWEPKPPHDPINGPILQLSLLDRGPVELTAAMPRWQEVEA